MTIDKAIEILSDHDRLPLVFKNPDLHASIKLAIDALKFLAECHTDGCLFKTFSPTGEAPQ